MANNEFAESLVLQIMLDSKVIVEHVRENILKKIREAGYPSVEKFALETGLVKTTVYRAINGARNPRLMTLIELANALEISLSDLLDLSSIEKPSKSAKKTARRGRVRSGGSCCAVRSRMTI